MPDTDDTFEVIRSPRRKRIAFRIRPDDGVLEVLAPPAVPDAFIAQTVKRHAAVIGQLRQKVAEKMRTAPVYSFEEGEFFLYRGCWYPLKFTKRVRAFDNAFFVPSGTVEEIKKNLEKLYRQLAADHLPPLVRASAAEYGLAVKDIHITGASGRWGSCSSTGNINFSWKLIQCPDEIIRYVICHELAHRLEFNHSERFWKEVGKLCPDYEELEEFLRENEIRYRAW